MTQQAFGLKLTVRALIDEAIVKFCPQEIEHNLSEGEKVVSAQYLVNKNVVDGYSASSASHYIELPGIAGNLMIRVILQTSLGRELSASARVQSALAA